MPLMRIIPCLDVDDGLVKKGCRFQNLRTVGDPVTLAEAYNRDGADELTFLDIGATVKSRSTLIDVVRAVSERVFVPLTVGGGIRTVDDIRELLRAGADKVSLCSAALRRPELLSEGAAIFGRQCLVLSLDAKRVGPGRWQAFVDGGSRDSGLDALAWAEQAAALGAGEILVNSIDGDGTGQGYDIELMQALNRRVRVPLIASGGAGCVDHLVDAVRNGGADALLLASLLHDGGLTISQIKQALREKGVETR
jgi:cyclase